MAGKKSEKGFNGLAASSRKMAADLVYAAKHGSIRKVKELLAAGADINAHDDTGYTALHAAAALGKTDVLSYLIECGADLNIKNKNDMTPLLWAVYNTREDNACLLIEAGADVNIPDDEGFSPLIMAVRRGRARTVIKLIEYSADLAHKDKYGGTVQSWAHDIKRKEVSDALANALAIRQRRLDEEAQAAEKERQRQLFEATLEKQAALRDRARHFHPTIGGGI